MPRNLSNQTFPVFFSTTLKQSSSYIPALVAGVIMHVYDSKQRFVSNLYISLLCYRKRPRGESHYYFLPNHGSTPWLIQMIHRFSLSCHKIALNLTVSLAQCLKLFLFIFLPLPHLQCKFKYDAKQSFLQLFASFTVCRLIGSVCQFKII